MTSGKKSTQTRSSVSSRPQNLSIATSVGSQSVDSIETPIPATTSPIVPASVPMNSNVPVVFVDTDCETLAGSASEEKLHPDEVTRRINVIKSLLIGLYDEYVVHVDGGMHINKPQSPSSFSSSTTNRSTSSRSNRLSNWKKIVQENDEAIVAHEVDQYLDAPLDPTNEEDHFDILCWWKVNGCKYPVLAAIARDILAIQTSTVASESCFSTGGRVIDNFRSSLTPKSVEALICLQNWLLGDEIAELGKEDDEPTIENTEFYFNVEQEYESTAVSKNKCPHPTTKAKGKVITVPSGPIEV